MKVNEFIRIKSPYIYVCESPIVNTERNIFKYVVPYVLTNEQGFMLAIEVSRYGYLKVVKHLCTNFKIKDDNYWSTLFRNAVMWNQVNCAKYFMQFDLVYDPELLSQVKYYGNDKAYKYMKKHYFPEEQKCS